jgi:hypothetical protein
MDRACNMNGGENKHVYYWWKRRKGRGHYKDQKIGGWIILRWILERQDGWYGLNVDKVNLKAVVKAIMILWVP